MRGYPVCPPRRTSPHASVISWRNVLGSSERGGFARVILERAHYLLTGVCVDGVLEELAKKRILRLSIETRGGCGGLYGRIGGVE